MKNFDRLYVFLSSIMLVWKICSARIAQFGLFCMEIYYSGIFFLFVYLL